MERGGRRKPVELNLPGAECTGVIKMLTVVFLEKSGSEDVVLVALSLHGLL